MILEEQRVLQVNPVVYPEEVAVYKTLEADTVQVLMYSVVLIPGALDGQASVAQIQNLSSFEVVLSVPLDLWDLPSNCF